MFMHTYNNPAVGIKDISHTAKWVVVCYNEHTAPKVYIKLDNKHWGMVYVCDINSLVSKVANYHIINELRHIRDYKHGYVVYDTNSLPDNIAQIILQCNNKIYYRR